MTTSEFAGGSEMSDSARIPTNLRTLLILEVLGRSDRALTATEINCEIGLPKQTVHRLCATLEAEGFLTRHDNSKSFHPARRLRELGAGLLYNSRVHIARRQILMQVAEEVGETVNFVVPEDAGMSYLDRVETGWAFQIQLPIGTHVPFHCTASGKCFLASLSPSTQRRIVASLDLRALTPSTLSTADALVGDLKLIRKRGYALDQEEFIEGMVAIAVPVTDRFDRFVAALAFHGPTQRLSIEDAIAKRGVLVEAAARLQDAVFGEE